MTRFDRQLSAQLANLRAEGLHRTLRTIDSAQSAQIALSGKQILNFSSNDYLGLANHPALKQAANAAVEKFGAGSGASRLVCGSLRPHVELEEELANFKQAEACIAFSSGHAAALGAIGALVSRNDVVILDKLVHASIIDAARLSGATIRIFPHNDLNALEKLLKRMRASQGDSSSSPPRVLIVVESVYSMDGDCSPLRELAALKHAYDASLMVDEAHATGILGPGGRGLASALGVSSEIDVHMGTLGKALGSAGGFIAGSRVLVDFLVNRARSFIFSTAPVPAAAAAATAGIRLACAKEGDDLRARLWSNITATASLLRIQKPQSAIIPLILGKEEAAVECSARLLDQGIFVPAIRFPTVARGRARLRVTVTSSHTDEQIARLSEALISVGALASTS